MAHKNKSQVLFTPVPMQNALCNTSQAYFSDGIRNFQLAQSKRMGVVSEPMTFHERHKKILLSLLAIRLFTFRVSRRRREMYIGQARLSVCMSVRRSMPTLLHGP